PLRILGRPRWQSHRRPIGTTSGLTQLASRPAAAAAAAAFFAAGRAAALLETLCPTPSRRPPRPRLCLPRRSSAPASPLRPRPARRSAPAAPPSQAATLPCPGRLAPLQAGGSLPVRTPALGSA
uniref:Uncharacterized protein n=1 Tax=Aegilops tauschii subsp. strangulata TaxID=200361 RepID=A0A453GEP2_AEGTS